jgi:UDP-2,3-diacylglucosamine pyrophosphatase LpxH
MELIEMPHESTVEQPLNLDLIAASSDAHWGGANAANIANYAGDLAVWDAMFAYRPRIDVFVRLGDWWDFWRAPYEEVLLHNEARSRELAKRLKQERRYVFYILGNHDWVNPTKLAKDLSRFGFDSSVLSVCTGNVRLGKWQLEHGSRFDPFCNPRSPLFWLGQGASKVVSGFQALTHWRFNDDYINPKKFFSARERGAKAVAAVRSSAAKWAIRNGAFLAYGHTHELDAFHDPWRGYSVVNTGCSSKGRAAWCLLQSDGEAVPRPIQGEF